MNQSTTLTGALARFVSALALGVFGVIVFRDLYNWFVVPLGAPVLSFAHLYGLLLLKGLLFYRQRKEEEASLTSALIYYLIVWAAGGIAAGFMA